MKLKAFIKISFKGLIKNVHIMLITFAIFPVIISVLYGYFQKDMFEKPNSISKISISIEDRDNTTISKNLISFLKSDNLKDLLEIKDGLEEKIVIPKGYGEKLFYNKDLKVVIEAKSNSQSSNFYILKDILDKYNKNLYEKFVINNNIKKLNLSNEEKLLLLNKVERDINRLYKQNVIKNKIVSSYKELNSYEYYSISISSFMSIILIISVTASYYNQKKKGIFNRIISTPISKFQYFNCQIINSILVAFVFNFIYVMAFRLLHLSFEGSLLLLILIIVFKSLLEASIVGIIIAFFKSKRVAGMFLKFFLMLSIVIGGVFYPLYKVVKENSVINYLSNYSPNVLIMKTYKNYVLFNSFHSIQFYLMMFLLTSIVFYFISILKIKVKWGE